MASAVAVEGVASYNAGLLGVSAGSRSQARVCAWAHARHVQGAAVVHVEVLA